MSILIKDMDMPKRCLDCPFMISRDNDDCILQSDEANAKFNSWDDMKASCPLVEIEEKPEPHWIPVTDALPQANEEVLITLSSGDIITIGWINRDGEWLIYEGDANADINDILAWQPLPEPFKGVTE